MDYIETRITISRYNELLEYWSEHPPVHLLVGALFNVKPKEPRTAEELAAMWQEVGGGIVHGPMPLPN